MRFSVSFGHLEPVSRTCQDTAHVGALVRVMVFVVLFLSACNDDDGILVVDGTGLFSPPRIDFGSHEIDERTELETVLMNPQSDDWVVDDVTFDPSTDVYVARLAEGGTLRGAFFARGQSRSLRISFKPREERSYDTRMLAVFGDTDMAERKDNEEICKGSKMRH